MSTNSTISISENGIRKTIYCHWDGYPQYNGLILLKHYTDIDKVKELINHGDISVLKENVQPNPNYPHDFDNKQENVTVFYGRDRGETGIEPRVYNKGEKQEMEEWNYKFLNNKWYVYFNREWIPLTNEFIERL